MMTITKKADKRQMKLTEKGAEEARLRYQVTEVRTSILFSTVSCAL